MSSLFTKYSKYNNLIISKLPQGKYSKCNLCLTTTQTAIITQNKKEEKITLTLTPKSLTTRIVKEKLTDKAAEKIFLTENLSIEGI